ncbi:hypothetical protein F7725_022463 [Dissostichus mawsoni]|uniref:Enhancer of mRNA-decapping protein 4 n=1 Tax=Dissostichus mawsoni TaxID=36200 RepID=A0A7J5Z280_DISMA|nr:hypothetical protein F7725_022463 [Dissostichus mawsoni]
MASNSNIDIEGATQHLRDILKLDRPGNSTDAPSSDGPRMPSFNGELNGLLGAAGLLGNTDRSTMSDSTRPISTDLCSTQECQIMKIQPVAKYDWEHKYYYGRLIAVSNSFVAYAIRGANNHAMIRVLSVGSAERSLLKGFTGAVTDLAFAHLDSSLLGCVDEAGNLMVWQLTCTASKILYPDIGGSYPTARRLPAELPPPPHMEDNEENQDDPSQTLALLHEDLAEVWDLEVLRATYSSWPVDAADVKDGLITVKGHTQRVSEGALSPDGTVLATASHDGYIKFWQIYIEGGENQPRCLHELRPHGGRPFPAFFSATTTKDRTPTDQNQELKLWCTVSWTCLQTIRFSPDMFNSSVLPSLKASLDLSSEFLILTDVQRKVLYVMELRQDLDKGMATFTAVSEFLLTHPVLSFGVRDVAHSRLRHTEGIQGPTESKSGIQIKLYCVHTKSLQDVQIWFQPNLSSNFPCFLPHSDSQDGFELRQGIRNGSQTDLRKIPSLPAPTDFLSNSGANSITKLMTPDAFMTPSASVPASPGSSASSLSTALASPSGPLALDGPQVLDAPLLPPLASPTRTRSPDVISSASTAMSQDMPEIASQTLQLQRVLGSSLESSPLSALQTDSMASAASALHLLTSPRTANNNSLLSLELGGADISVGGAVESEPRLSNTPSLLENALSQENPGAGGGSEGSISHTPWPAAPDITRETRNSLRDNGLGDCSREEAKDRHLNSPYHRRSYHLPQNDSQDAGAEQSDPDDEVPTMAASSGNCGRSSHRLPVKEWKTSPRGSPKVKRKTKKDDSESSQSRQMESSQMNAEVQDELLMLLRSQQRELTELRGQITAMQSTIMVQVEHVLSNHQEQEQRRLERVLAESQNHQQQLQDQLSQQLSHTLSSVLTNRMDKVLREEMKKTVPQTISKCLEPVTGQLNNTIAAKLTAAMQGPIQAAYKDAFQSIVLPVFERGCQSMFQQINDSFKQGTQEYIQQLESHMKNRQQRELEAREPVVGQLQQMIESFQSSTDQLANNITANVRAEVQHQIQMMVGNLQETILSHVQRIVKGEVTMAMKEQQAVVTSSIMQAMRSGRHPPHHDYQTQQANILQLLQQGQLNQAFQQALSATDLNLVLYVCETIDSQQVFGQHPCPLSQPVLLSLIQQLSSNLTTRSELKISYLEDAVMNLDHGDPLTRDHMSSVLAQVRPKLFTFLQQDPHSPLSKRARRLMMMLQGLVSH